MHAGRSMLHAVLCVGLMTAVALPRCAVAQATASATAPAPQQNPHYQRTVTEQAARAKAANPDLLFIGDSITANWMRVGKQPWGKIHAVWTRWYGDRRAFEMGIGSDRTQNVLWRLAQGQVDGLSPRLVVLLIGTNNVGQGQPAEVVEQGILAVTTDLHQRLPQAHILVLGLYPREPEVRDAVCRQVNALLARDVAALRYASFADVGRVLLTADGRPDPTLYIEGSKGHQVRVLHPNAFGAERLAHELDPQIVRWLGPR